MNKIRRRSEDVCSNIFWKREGRPHFFGPHWLKCVWGQKCFEHKSFEGTLSKSCVSTIHDKKMKFLRMLCKIKQAPIRTQFLACPNTSLGESIFSMIIWQYSSEAHNHKPGIYWDFLGMHPVMEFVKSILGMGPLLGPFEHYTGAPSLGFPAVYWFSRHLLTTFYNTHLVLIKQTVLTHIWYWWNRKY